MAKPLCKMTLKDLLDYLALQEKNQAEPVSSKQVDVAKIEIVPIPRQQVKIDEKTFIEAHLTERRRTLSVN